MAVLGGKGVRTHGALRSAMCALSLACALTVVALALRGENARLFGEEPLKEKPAADTSPDKPPAAKKRAVRKIVDTISTGELYKQREKQEKRRVESGPGRDHEDLSSMHKSASEEIESIIVFLGEIPATGGRKALYAPVFLSESKGIFGTGTDFSLRWVGYKLSTRFTQKRFPWDNTTLSETLVGSFLYASGTNIGFQGNAVVEERRFYTNYTSQIVTLKVGLPFRAYAGFTLDSRQYFFVRRNAPEDFIMPNDHINLFPRIDLGIERLTEKGIDQIKQGFSLESWAGYGIRNKWERWGEEPILEDTTCARTFAIYSCEFTAGALFLRTHNLVFRAHYKGGIDNDFLTRPRFGGTIDNANLDVVHGFTVDNFRVESFGLVNLKYAFDAASRLRINVFLDYARIFDPDPEHVAGSGYGVRILAVGGLPVWITHGIGRREFPGNARWEHVVMVMTAAGW
ncbi:MAG TPA: hypothetical protein VLM75_14155 [Spirochaetota bacterium]|nr:hypothetical protein [Spirochaetota bacterium]